MGRATPHPGRLVPSVKGSLPSPSVLSGIGTSTGLGKIVALAERLGNETLSVNLLGSELRAFNRRIEHQCLSTLFERFGVREVLYEFRPTDRNAYVQEFFTELLGHSGRQHFVVSEFRWTRC
jgi:hypothetical protein